MSKAIGIDLGTTFTCVAYMKTDEIVEVIANNRGDKITPSVVYFGDYVTKVGEDAVAMRGKDAKNTIYQVKRFMGRRASDPEIKKRKYPFEIIASKKGNAAIRIKPKREDSKVEYCPEEISNSIIRYAKKIAEKEIGHEVTHAVITVPANFSNDQREATKYAGEMAGLKVLRILNEPTAAALAYGFERKNNNKQRIVLVYDLGGGTFDVSIVKITGTESEVLSTEGQTFLGGEDFDDRIYEEAVRKFKEMGVEIPKEQEFPLYKSCEQAKRELSTSQLAEITTFNSRGEKKSCKITRNTFEELCNHLFSKTIDCVKKAIKESGCQMDSIDDVVLVGGSSRIPRVQVLLQQLFDKKTLKFDIPPDYAVAQGAAILAESLALDSRTPVKRDRGAVKLVDVTPFSFGCSLIGDRMSKVMTKNTRYPAKEVDMFYNAFDNQAALRFEIYEGEEQVASDNNFLGEFVITVPPRPSGENKMETTFSIDADGILNVHVLDKETGKEAEITITTNMLSPDERAKLSNEVKRRFEDEAVYQAKIEARTAFNDALSRCKMRIRRVNDATIKQHIQKIVDNAQRWFDVKEHSNEELHKRANAVRKELSPFL